tara:strand:+ start:8598 stop:9089 length:492 start_codon:yes stop_codon:yes gene_type:complete
VNTYSLTLLERHNINRILPQQASILDGIVITGLNKLLRFSEEDQEKYGIVTVCQCGVHEPAHDVLPESRSVDNPEGTPFDHEVRAAGLYWGEEFTDTLFNFELTERQVEIIVVQIKALDEAGSVPLDQIDTYLKFWEPEGIEENVTPAPVEVGVGAPALSQTQ